MSMLLVRAALELASAAIELGAHGNRRGTRRTMLLGPHLPPTLDYA